MTAYETEYPGVDEENGVTPEAKKADVKSLVMEYKPDSLQVFQDKDGDVTYVIAHAQYVDMYKQHEYDDVLSYLAELSKRTDVADISVLITAAFETR